MATETITQTNLPAPFIETMGKTFGEGITRLAAKPIDTTKFQPTVAYQGALGQAGQQAAATQAGLGALQFDPTTGAVTGAGAGTGIAGYQPYLTGAAGYGTAAAGLTGTGAGTGAGSIASYMSPYTTNVIDAMKDQMADVKAQQDIARNAQAVGAGAFVELRLVVIEPILVDIDLIPFDSYNLVVLHLHLVGKPCLVVEQPSVQPFYYILCPLRIVEFLVSLHQKLLRLPLVHFLQCLVVL